MNIRNILFLLVLVNMCQTVEANFFVNAYHWAMNIPRLPVVKKYTQIISDNPISSVILAAYFGAAQPKTKLIIVGCVAGCIAILEFFERFRLKLSLDSKVESIPPRVINVDSSSVRSAAPQRPVSAPAKIVSGGSRGAIVMSPQRQVVEELNARFKKK